VGSIKNKEQRTLTGHQDRTKRREEPGSFMIPALEILMVDIVIVSLVCCVVLINYLLTYIHRSLDQHNEERSSRNI